MLTLIWERVEIWFLEPSQRLKDGVWFLDLKRLLGRLWNKLLYYFGTQKQKNRDSLSKLPRVLWPGKVSWNTQTDKKSGRRRRKRKSLKSKKHYNWCISHPILFSNKTSCRKKASRLENSLAVQWLRLGAFTAKGPGLKSGGGTKILKVTQPKLEIILKKKKREEFPWWSSG